MIQNQASRLLLDKGVAGHFNQDLPTVDLLNTTDSLSIHQLGVQGTLVMVKKIILSEKPTYIFDKLKMQSNRGKRSGQTIEPINPTLNLKRSSFIYRSIKLFNMLPESLRNEDNITRFKKTLKIWVKETIAIKP